MLKNHEGQHVPIVTFRQYVEVPLDKKIRGKVLGAVSGRMTVPQVFANGALVGSADELEVWIGARR